MEESQTFGQQSVSVIVLNIFKKWYDFLNSEYNRKSQFRDEYTLEQIMASPPVYGPLTKLQCCPTSDGSAAAVLVSEAFATKHGLLDRAVEIMGMEMTTDLSSTFENSSMKLVYNNQPSFCL